MTRPLAALVLLLATTFVASAASPPALWIDVRTASEFAAGHLPGAINLPYQEIAVRIAGIEADKSRPIRLYCGIGVRAQMAKYALEAQGYLAVRNEGGYAELARIHGSIADSGQAKHESAMARRPWVRATTSHDKQRQGESSR